MPTWENTLLKALLDLGYECWLTNSRGTRYSWEHQNLTTKDIKFWDFSFEEMALYDLPATVDYIKKYTEVEKLSAYIGHSQGTIQMFARLCLTPEFSDNMNIFVGLAPVAFGKYIP